jgi:hypothetical protein
MTRQTRAQALVLESILLHRPLPGIGRVVAFSGIGPGESGSQILLVDDRDTSDLGLPSQLRIMSHTEFATFHPDEQVRVLEFLTPEEFPGKISVRVQMSIAVPNEGLFPVEGMVATFADRDPLRAVEPTSVMAF